jgi:hypothetical protein
VPQTAFHVVRRQPVARAAATNPVSSAQRADTSDGLPSTVNGDMIIIGGVLG